ncbi:MAG: helix-turn-helix transcriptional regulator [Kiritimatiellae bacterium]|nr:helix-turn-helix transcriptional regulator [Kiritimatiellia bacterium]MBQ6327378.1 helix-turn-helix transcriptional regulator [Kiritimatiellia bacterium]
MSAYPETLLPNARSQLADATDYAVVDLGVPIDEFFSLFAASDWARRIERGDRSTVLGISGIELAQNVLAEKTGAREFKTARESLRRTKAYWTGWVLAYYQWKSNRTFREILRALPASTIEQMYGVYHEAPEERFAATADEILREKIPETRLKRVRSAYGCSQSRLSEMSGVGLRSIQMYEQRRKDINKAEAESVLRLARALGCEIEDIMEP